MTTPTPPGGAPATFASVPPAKPEIERDRYGRPLVAHPVTGKLVGYTRCTTYVGGIEDTWNLSRWTQRTVTYGLAISPDLQALVRDMPADDKAKTREQKAEHDRLCEAAKEAGGGNDAARWGTYMHALTEAVDLGYDPDAVAPPQLAFPRDHAQAVTDLAAYIDATADLKHRLVEAFTVQDPLQVGGTPDRVVEYQGKRYIADLKTGNVEFGSLKIAAQLAMYARSQPYDIATGQRTDPHGASVERGILIHLPVGSGTCTLSWVDLLAGWEAVRVCRQIREQRKAKARDLFSPWDAPVPTEPVADGETLYPDPAPVHTQAVLAGRVKATTSREQALAVWRANEADWTDDLTELAKAHIASLA